MLAMCWKKIGCHVLPVHQKSKCFRFFFVEVLGVLVVYFELVSYFVFILIIFSVNTFRARTILLKCCYRWIWQIIECRIFLSECFWMRFGFKRKCTLVQYTEDRAHRYMNIFLIKYQSIICFQKLLKVNSTLYSVHKEELRGQKQINSKGEKVQL
jgi:hypothetical protein